MTKLIYPIIISLTFALGCDSPESAVGQGDPLPLIEKNQNPEVPESSPTGPSDEESPTIAPGTSSIEANVELKNEIEIVEQIDNLNLQSKGVNLLKSSIESCIGPGMTVIKSEMFIKNFRENSQDHSVSGKVQFLSELDFTHGDDIIDSLDDFLVNYENANRLSTAVDTLSFTILNAMQVVADVVAHNCTDANPGCKCQTIARSEQMVGRCFPYLDRFSPEFRDAVQAVHGVCSQEEFKQSDEDTDGIPGYRAAVASIIASIAFAISR